MYGEIDTIQEENMHKKNKIIITVMVLVVACIVCLYIINYINYHNRINDIERDVVLLLEHEDDLYKINELACRFLTNKGDSLDMMRIREYVIKKNGTIDTSDLSNDKDYTSLKYYLSKYNINNLYRDEEAIIISIGYLIEDNGFGFYERKIIMTNTLYTQENIKNYYALPSNVEYKRKIDTYGRVIWKYSNWIHEETVIAKQLRENIWSFERVYKGGVLSILGN